MGIATSRTSPLAGFSLPTKLPPCTVNQRSPFAASTSVWGSRAAASGMGYLRTCPVAGSSRPMCPFPFPAYQTAPLRLTIRLCGSAPASSS